MRDPRLSTLSVTVATLMVMSSRRCVAPKGTELVAVSFAFFGETGGDVLDSFKALFVGHGLLKYSGVKVA